MIETMHEDTGVGLAAPQVHVSRQVAVLQVDKLPAIRRPARPAERSDQSRLIIASQDKGEQWEGCLSIPELARGGAPLP